MIAAVNAKQRPACERLWRLTGHGASGARRALRPLNHAPGTTPITREEAGRWAPAHILDTGEMPPGLKKLQGGAHVSHHRMCRPASAGAGAAWRATASAGTLEVLGHEQHTVAGAADAATSPLAR